MLHLQKGLKEAPCLFQEILLTRSVKLMATYGIYDNWNLSIFRLKSYYA